MQNEEYVYFLSVEYANAIAAEHEDDETWDIWTDDEARLAGCVSKYDRLSPYNVRRSA